MRLLHVRRLGLLYGLLGGVGQGDQPREDHIQLLYGGTFSGLPVDVSRNREALPYGCGHLADVGGDGPLADPEQVGHAVLDKIGAVIHEYQKNPVPQAWGERAARADLAPVARSSLFRYASE